MDIRYTYLAINLATVAGPLLLSFHPSISFYRNWRNILITTLLCGFIFIGWDIVFTNNGIWSFSKFHTTGVKFLGLPIEEIMFFFTVPYAMIFVYECIKHYFADRQYNLKITYLVLYGPISLAALVYLSRTYTVVILLLSGLMLLYGAVNKFMQSKYFLLYLLFSLIGFVLVNYFLTSIPVVIYSAAENSGFRISTIPVEDFFYMFLMNTTYLLTYRHLKSQSAIKDE